MRKVAKLLPYIVLLLLAILAVLVLLRYGTLAEHVRRAIVAELSRQTDRDVAIGTVSVSLSGRAVLRDLQIRNRDGTALLTAPEAAVRVGRPGSWLPILSGPTEVREVRLRRPEVNITRGADGSWSITDLVRRKPEAPPRFQGQIIVEDGRLTLLDDARGGVATALQHVDLSVRYPEPGQPVFRLRAQGTDGAFSHLELSGRAGPEGEGTTVSGSISDLDLPYATARLPEIHAFSITAGRADVEARVSLAPAGSPPDISYHVEADLRDASVSFPWLRRPIEGVSGRLRLAEGDLHLDGLSGTLEDTPVSAEGRISDLQNPQLAIDFSAGGLRYQQLRALLPGFYLPATLLLPAPLHIAGRAEGPASDVTVSGRAEVRVIKFRLVPWRDVAAKFRYARGHLRISGLSAHGSPRRLEADLDVNWAAGRPRTQANVDLKDVPLSVLAQMAGLDASALQGTGSLTAAVRVDGGSSVEGRIVAHDAAFGDLPLGRVAADFRLSDQVVTVTKGAIEGPLAAGSFSLKLSLPDRCQVEADLSRLDLALLGPALGRPDLSGRFPVAARVSGSPSGPRATGRIKLGPGLLQGFPFDALETSLTISPDQLRLSDLRFVSARGEARGTFEMTGWRQPAAQAGMLGHLEVEGISPRDWLADGWAGLIPAGTVHGTVDISGTQAAPRLSMDLLMQSPTLAGLPMETGRAALRYEQGRLFLDEVTLNDGRTYIKVAGGYDLLTGLDLELTADPLDLETVSLAARSRWGLAVTGRLRARAHAQGHTGDPRITFRVASDTIALNEVALDDLDVSGEVQDGMLRIQSASVRQAEGKLSAAGAVSLTSGALDLLLDIQDLDLFSAFSVADRAVWRLARSGAPVSGLRTYAAIPRPVEGRLDTTVKLSGSYRDPRADAHLTVDGLSFAEREISRVEGDVGLSRQNLHLELRATHEDAHASITGDLPLSPDGETFLSADIGNLDLGMLGPWFRYAVDLGGEATINFVISGPTAQPVLRGDIFIDRLRLGTLQLEAASASPIWVKSGRLTMEEIRLRNGPLEALGKASLPLSLPGIPTAPDLLALPTAELHLRGAEFAPLPGMTPALLDADLYLSGNRLLLYQEPPAGSSPSPAPGIRGTMGSGTVSVSGEALLASLDPRSWDANRFDITCRLQSIDLELPDTITGKLDGDLQLTNDPQTGRAVLMTPGDRPLVLSHATVRIPKQMPTLPPAAALAFYPDVRVTVLVGDRVRFRSGAEQRPTEINIDPAEIVNGTPLSGYLYLDGALSAAALTLDGQLQTRKGQLAFPNGILTLRSGAAWIRREAMAPLRIRVTAEAEGQVGDYRVSVNPAGQIYPLVTSEQVGALGAPFRLNASSIPYLDEAYVLALLAGPVVAPTRGPSRDPVALLTTPGAPAATGEITGIMLPPLGSALGMHQLSLDFAFQGPVRLRLGERIFRRVVVSYLSALSGPGETRTLRVTYEITPLWSIGWSVDEVDRTRWEVQAFVPF